jgi:HSP20 family protein
MEIFDMIPRRRGGEVTTLRREMDRVFDRFFDGWPFRPLSEGRDWAPSVDVSETANEVVVKAEVPGMDAKDIDITITGDILTIRGERKQEKEEKDENFHCIERSYGAFSRSIRLPAEVEKDKVDAAYKDGVLKITMSKTKKASQKKIEVKAA